MASTTRVGSSTTRRASRPGAREAKSPLPLKTVLIVDDDNDCLEVTRLLLKYWRYRVRTATNGREALEYFERGGKASLILLDLMMPVMTGIEFLAERRLHADIAAIPVVIVTATDRLARKNIEPVLTKPIDAAALKEVVERLCA